MAALNPTHAIKQQLNQPLLNHQNNITDNDDNSFSINSFYPDDYGVRSRSQSHLQNGDSHSLNPSNDSHNYLSRLESIQTPFVQKFLRHIPIATHAMQANEALTTGQAIWQSIPHTHFATHKQHQLTMLEAFFYFYRASSYSIQANVLCGTILDRWSDQDAPACQLLYNYLQGNINRLLNQQNGHVYMTGDAVVLPNNIVDDGNNEHQQDNKEEEQEANLHNPDFVSVNDNHPPILADDDIEDELEEKRASLSPSAHDDNPSTHPTSWSFNVLASTDFSAQENQRRIEEKELSIIKADPVLNDYYGTIISTLNGRINGATNVQSGAVKYNSGFATKHASSASGQILHQASELILSDMAKSIPIASTIATGIEQVRKRASQKDLTSLSVLFTNPTTQYTVVERLARQLTLAQANTLHALPSLSPLKKTQDTLMGHTNNAATAKALEDSEIILDGMLVEHPVNEQKPYAIDDYVALLYQDVMGENAVYVSPVSLTPHRKKSQSMTLTVQSPDALSLPSRSSSYDSPKAIKTPSARSNHSQTSSLPISAYSSSLMSLENHRLSQQLQKQVRLTQMLAANNQTLKQQVAQIPQLQQQLSAVNDKNEKMEQQLSAVNDKNKKMEQQMLMMQKQVMAMQQWMEQQKMASTSAQLSPKPNDQ